MNLANVWVAASNGKFMITLCYQPHEAYIYCVKTGEYMDLDEFEDGKFPSGVVLTWEDYDFIEQNWPKICSWLSKKRYA